MGRPPGEPSKVVRLPLPVAALAKRLAEKSLRAGDINAFFDIEVRRPATVGVWVATEQKTDTRSACL
jgi:DNA polymerase V